MAALPVTEATLFYRNKLPNRVFWDNLTILTSLARGTKRLNRAHPGRTRLSRFETVIVASSAGKIGGFAGNVGPAPGRGTFQPRNRQLAARLECPRHPWRPGDVSCYGFKCFLKNRHFASAACCWAWPRKPWPCPGRTSSVCGAPAAFSFWSSKRACCSGTRRSRSP